MLRRGVPAIPCRKIQCFDLVPRCLYDNEVDDGGCAPMGWLNFERPLEDELQIERQARVIRGCHDVKELQEISEKLFRSWAQQCDITAQLIRQVAELEVQAGLEDGDSDYVSWARSLYQEKA